MASATSSPGSASPGSQVHAAAVNGDRSALVKLITAEPQLRDHEDQFGRTPLMYCVLADRLDCAEVLLKAGASVNKTDHSQRSALHLAAQKGNVRFLKLLLSRRANCLQKDLEGMTPLHLATRHPSPKALALLLKHIGPGEVDTQDKNKQTALHWSAFYNRPEHVRLLIKHDSNIGIPDSEGKIPLHWAAHSQEASATQTVHCILEAAPTESLLNWQDYEGRTPLHFAVADGNEAVVEVLTSYEGCNVTAYDNLFRTPLHWAALLGHAKIVHLLLERNTSGTIPSDSQGATPLHYGAQSNNAETVGVFLSHPSVKDEPDLEGRTAFMWAAGKGSDEVIRTMLSLVPRIDINMADKYGGTALHAASLSGQVSTVKLLLEKGATVDSLDVMKHTPLFRACEMGYKDVILTLIKGSACVELVDVDGHTALHWAALGGNAEVCQILMENGISPNVQDHAGRTPLQCAAYGGYITCMAVLMENNADPNIQDKEGRTAIHWSCNNGYLDAVKLLLGYHAFPNQMELTEERYTPLDYALLGGHSEVTQFMLEHGALSIAAIQDIAAATIQAVYKGYTVRKAFRERKQLLMRHEQLRKDAAKKREEEQRRRGATQHVGADGADKPRVSLLRAEQEARSLTNIVEDLTVNDSSVDTKTHAKVKEGRHKGQKIRISGRSLAAERQEALSCSPVLGDRSPPEASQHSRLKKLLSPAGSRQPPTLKPTPPTAAKAAGERSSSVASAASVTASSADRAEANSRDGRKKDPATTGHSSRKHRNHKEPSSEVRHQAPSLRSSSSLDHKRPRRKTQSGGREHEKEQARRNDAARIIQRAWQRFCARRRTEVRACEEAKQSKSSCTPGRKKAENRAAFGKPVSSKSSVLQSIYGNSMARRGRSLQGSQPHLLLNVPLRTQSQLGGLDCIHLTGALTQAKLYSYHLRPQSAGQGTRGRGKH
ncbi:inversin isoform X1 [Gambusia affinis]|uniref:inversin isoform X1 n=1 Tax=Gambusia affinis TaxID=33528 RepID=UPI001CDD3000|nr:inversin isoform X1 [Gambusia affinis]XP_043973839.1 inversin isoform X1 [Gambusia affinis]